MLKVLALACGLLSPDTWASDKTSISEAHPPVLITVAQKKLAIFFLKNNFKSEIKGTHVADAEIFYSLVDASDLKFKYVWKIEGDQIASVFFYDWKSSGRLGKSMYVLTKSRFSRPDFEGFEYSTIEFPITNKDDGPAVSFFQNDLPDPNLERCIDGRNLVSGELVVCAYKDAGSIKRYLAKNDK